MAWFSPFTRDVVDLSAEELTPDQPAASLLDRGRASIALTLDRCRADEARLVDEIEDRKEQLRQTQVAIQAFEAAEKIMIDGDADFAEVEPLAGLRGSALGSPTIVTRQVLSS